MRKLIMALLMTAFLAPLSGVREPTTVVSQAGCVAPPAGMISWWDADEVMGTTVVDIQDGNDGTMVGNVAIVPGVVGNAFNFDGDASIQIPNSANLEPSEITVDAWVRSNGSPGSFRYIVSKGADSCLFSSYALYTGSSGGLFFYISNGSTFFLSPNAGTGVWNGEWHHVAGTFDGSTVRLYVDGAEVGSGTSVSDPIAYNLPTTNDLFIGEYAASGSCSVDVSFVGDIDEVEIFNRALSGAEIADIFAAGSAGKCKDGTPPPPPPPPSGVNCALEPATATNLVGTSHTVAVTVTAGGEPQPGVIVFFTITDGPNAGITTGAITERDGRASFFYVSNGIAGTDTIEASGTVGGESFSCTATKEWTENTCILQPEAVRGPVGIDHTVRVTVFVNRKPRPGTRVRFRITRGPNIGLTDMAFTDFFGEAFFTYTSEEVGTDVIEASGTVNGMPFSCTATKEWTEGGIIAGLRPLPGPVFSGSGNLGNPSITSGTAVGCPVNVSNGNMFHQFEDMNIVSRGFPIRLVRTYNSRSAIDGPFGFGWTHSYNMFLAKNRRSVVFINESGGQFVFTWHQRGFIAPPGLNMTLTEESHGFTLRKKDGTELRFDTNGRLQSLTDRHGNAQRLSYDGRGNLQTITDALGREITFTYNAQNKIVEIRDFTGRRLFYDYDEAGNLIESVDFGGNKTRYTYYSNFFNDHNLKTITFPEGNTITYIYDMDDRASKVIGPGGGEMKFEYGPFRRTRVTDERGFVWTFKYNRNGNVTQSIDPEGNVVEQKWDENANLIARTDEAGFTTRFEYDERGNLLKQTDPLGNTVQFTYEPKFNLATSIRDKNGHLTRFEYDARGNLTKIIDALGGEATFTYDDFGNPLTFTNAEGNTFSITYDRLNNPIEIRDALGNVTQLRFDALGRLTSVIDPLDNELHLEYDSLDRVTKVIDPLGNSTTFGYDGNGDVVRRTDANGHVTHFAYDRWGNLTQVTDALGNVIQYGYETEECFCVFTSNVTSFTNARGETWTYAYNFRNQLTEIRDPLDNITRLAYDARGNLIQKTDANGNTIRFEYDALNRLIQKIFPDGTQERFTYDANGNLLTASNQHVTLTFAYDELNRVTSVTDSRFPKTIRYTYDRIHNRKTLIDPEGGVTTYTYDGNSQVTAITNPSGQTTTFNYNALNRRVELTFPNGVVTTYSYDHASRLRSLISRLAGSSNSISSFSYTYDGTGNRTSASQQRAAVVVNSLLSYAYDALDRLIQATHPLPGEPLETFQYDPAGNRLRRDGQAVASVFDAANRLIEDETFTYTYDANGNLTSKTNKITGAITAYHYDFENQLVQVNLPNGAVVCYQYDALGRRIEKDVNGEITRYVYDDEDILLELDGANRLIARYTHGPRIDEPLIMERDLNGNGTFEADERFFYHTDGLGSITELTDSTGAVRQSYVYDSFGNIVAAICDGEVFTGVGVVQAALADPSVCLLNPFTYTAREFDAESGLYYYRARYHDAGAGRFLSEDPILFADLGLEVVLKLMSRELISRDPTRFLLADDQTHLYVYVNNNPSTFVDPTGLQQDSEPSLWQKILKIFVGGAARTPAGGRAAGPGITLVSGAKAVGETANSNAVPYAVEQQLLTAGEFYLAEKFHREVIEKGGGWMEAKRWLAENPEANEIISEIPRPFCPQGAGRLFNKNQ